MQQNLISAAIPQTVIDQITKNLQQNSELLNPFLHNLLPEDRNSFAKMGDKTLPFVNKALDYAKIEPMIVPKFIDITEADADALLANQLDGLMKLCQPFVQSVTDSMMMAGSDAYAVSLSIYDAAKSAAANNVPGATAIVADLSQRFPGRRRKTTSESKNDSPVSK